MPVKGIHELLEGDVRIEPLGPCQKMVIGDIYHNTFEITALSQPGFAAGHRWMLVREQINGAMHREPRIELSACALPASAFQEVGKQIAMLISDMFLGQENMCEPVH